MTIVVGAVGWTCTRLPYRSRIAVATLVALGARGEDFGVVLAEAGQIALIFLGGKDADDAGFFLAPVNETVRRGDFLHHLHGGNWAGKAMFFSCLPLPTAQFLGQSAARANAWRPRSVRSRNSATVQQLTAGGIQVLVRELARSVQRLRLSQAGNSRQPRRPGRRAAPLEAPFCALDFPPSGPSLIGPVGPIGLMCRTWLAAS